MGVIVGVGMTGEVHPRGGSWKARPWWARLVHLLALLGPVSAGVCAAIALSGWLPVPSSVVGVVVRVVFVTTASTAVVVVVDRVARRLLPLAALYRLSLVFPDQAPSRFRSALKAGSSRRVARLVTQTRRHGLPDDPGEAATRLVELIGAIGDHDRRTRGHSERVRLYAGLIGEEMHLPKEDRQKLQWAALLHDLGKLMVPGEILNKNGAPTGAEWRVLRKHPAEGEELVAPLRPFLGMWADAVGGHHEWWNGKGYPRGLRGSEISPSAAIVAVADAYEVMTAARSYKKPMAASAARKELTRSAGTQFSPEVVRAFLCVSLGRLRVAAGPAASFAQVPLFGTAARFPAALSTAMQRAGALAAAAAPAVAVSLVAATTIGVSASTAKPFEQLVHEAALFRAGTHAAPSSAKHAPNHAASVKGTAPRWNSASLPATDNAVRPPTTTTTLSAPQDATTTSAPSTETTTSAPSSETTTSAPPGETTTSAPTTVTTTRPPWTEHGGGGD